MKLLADTHIIIWALLDNDRLPAKARALLSDPNNTVFFSPVSVWEIAMKHTAHPRELPFTGKTFFELCLRSGMQLSEMRISHVLAYESLHRAEGAPAHKDPFDRLLIAQAKTENLVLLTHDSLLSDYEEPCVLLV
jgi:PIN domain nuclease of toxin-antitoxin system